MRDLDGRTYAAATVDLPSLQAHRARGLRRDGGRLGQRGLEAAVRLGGDDGPDLRALRDFGGDGGRRPPRRPARPGHGSGVTAAAAGTFRLGDRTVNRLGFGAMRLTGSAAMGRGTSRPVDQSVAVLRRAVELGVNHVDTAAFYFSADSAANADHPDGAGAVPGRPGDRDQGRPAPRPPTARGWTGRAPRTSVPRSSAT